MSSLHYPFTVCRSCVAALCSLADAIKQRRCGAPRFPCNRPKIRRQARSVGDAGRVQDTDRQREGADQDRGADLRRLDLPDQIWQQQARDDEGEDLDRSEEHTSELQSLMRTSYADFCLKTKTRLQT